MAVPDWVRIWLRARSAASAAKSASRMVDILALLFWTLFIKLLLANSNRFCVAPKVDRWSLICWMAVSKPFMVDWVSPNEAKFVSDKDRLLTVADSIERDI